MATGQVRTTEELMAPPIKTTEELLKKKLDIPTQKKEVVKPPWYDNYLGLIRPILGGVQAGTAAGMKSLIKAADFISDKLGIPKSDAARMIAGDLEKFSQANKAKGVGGAVGDIASGLGEAVPAIASMMIMGPAGLPVHGAVLGGIEGGVQGALTGAASGALSHGVLKGMGGLATPARVGAGAVFGAATTPGGIEERAKGAAVMGGLSFAGGRPQRQVVDMRGKPTAGKIITTPTSAKPVSGPVTALVKSLEQSATLNPKQKAMYKAERGRRVATFQDIPPELSGEARFKAKKGKLFGEMPKADFEPLKITLEQKNALHDAIDFSPALNELEKIGLGEALNHMIGGKFPAIHEVKMFDKVFGPELVDVLMKKQSKFEKFKYWSSQIANVPRTMKASFDLSAPFRQGMFLVGRPKEFFGAFSDMIKSMRSEEGYRKVANGIANRPTSKLMRESKLALTELDAPLNQTEEGFLGASIIENFGKKIEGASTPVKVLGSPFILAGRGVRVSQRAYAGFLNKLRADTFDSIVDGAKRTGLYDVKSKTGEVTQNIDSNHLLSNEIARYVNAATGRGNLGPAEGGAKLLNAFLFSPRLVSSRMRLLNPLTYITGKGGGYENKFVRIEALKDMIRFGAVYTTIAALARLRGEEHLGAEPTSADFSKEIEGNTRIDMSGGMGNYVRLGAQLVLGKTTSSTTGNVTILNKGYKGTTREDVIWRWLKSKENPILSFATSLLNGKDFIGQPLNVKKETISLITPMIMEDMYDMIKDDASIAKILGLTAVGALGGGIQTYPSKGKRTTYIR